MVLKVLQAVLAIWVVIFFVTQIIIPALLKEQLFPLFNKKRRDALNAMRRANTTRATQDIRRTTTRKRSNTKASRVGKRR